MSEIMPNYLLLNLDDITDEKFYKPTMELIDNIIPGNRVKLILRTCPPDFRVTEKVWFTVTEVMGNRKFKGSLNHYAFVISFLKYGDIVEFDACNIADINE